MQKDSSALIYMMEELTDARLRCEQLKRYIGDAVKLIEQSSHRDHFFEVAGHLLHGIPESLFKLDKALSATALAASKLDYDELKLALKPEKVEELERVLDEARIRQIPRRSGDSQMTPKDTAKAIRALASELETTGRFPVKQADEIVSILREQEPRIRLASIPCCLPPAVFTAMADSVESGSLRNRERLSAMLDTAITQALGGQQAVAILQQAGSREDVMRGFKKENPALTDAQLTEIADQWEANKNVVTDKTAAYRRVLPKGLLLKLVNAADNIRRVSRGTYPSKIIPGDALEKAIAYHKGDATAKIDFAPSYADKEITVSVEVGPYKEPYSLKLDREKFDAVLKSAGLMWGKDGVMKYVAPELGGKTARKGDGDPVWDVLGGIEIAFREMKKLDKIDKSNWPPRVKRALQSATEHLHHAEDDLTKAAQALDGTKTASDDDEDDADKTAGAGEAFQKVNPAITDEQVQIINEMHEKHKDVVKDKHKEAANLTDTFGDALHELSTALGQSEELVENAAAKCWKAWKAVEAPQGGGVKNEMRKLAPAVLDIVSACRKQQRVISNIRSMAWIDVRTAAEGDNVSKFTEGQPADPTENMTPEQKAEWEKQNKLHRDEFKNASKVVPLAEAKKGDMVEVTYRGKKFTGKVVQIKKDGTITVNPMDDNINDGAWIDFRLPKKAASEEYSR